MRGRQSPFGFPEVCPLGAGWQAFGACPSFRGVFPAFWLLCCFSCGGLCLNMALFRVLKGFLARFGAPVGVCIISVLCVACGAFVCVNS